MPHARPPVASPRAACPLSPPLLWSQVGLAGSSAILTAALRAVLRFYGFGAEDKAAAIGLSRDVLPAFVLGVESDELGIAAGLQDRVVQSYEGAVHMDFAPALLAAQVGRRGGEGGENTHVVCGGRRR